MPKELWVGNSEEVHPRNIISWEFYDSVCVMDSQVPITMANLDNFVGFAMNMTNVLETQKCQPDLTMSYKSEKWLKQNKQ